MILEIYLIIHAVCFVAQMLIWRACKQDLSHGEVASLTVNTLILAPAILIWCGAIKFLEVKSND